MFATLAAAAAVLLVVSGVAKVRAPGPAALTVGRLVPRAVRSPALRGLVRAGGVAEAAVGAAYLGLGGRATAALLGLAYLVFAAVAVRLIARGQRSSCGCFGATESPVGAAHVGLTLVSTAVAAGAVLAPPGAGAGAGLFAHAPVTAAVSCAQVLLLAWLGYLTITALPALASLRRLEEAR